MYRAGLIYIRAQNLEEAKKEAKLLYGIYLIDVI
jgi:hypothetical protein